MREDFHRIAGFWRHVGRRHQPGVEPPVALRYAVEFRAQRRSAEYREAPGGHPYSSIEITWRP